jgi:hypothetical protein
MFQTTPKTAEQTETSAILRMQVVIDEQAETIRELKQQLSEITLGDNFIYSSSMGSPDSFSISYNGS